MTMPEDPVPEPEDVCPYCAGANGAATTIDHVIPKCVFVRPYPADMITVKACERCNREKSRDDPFLRDVIATDFLAHDHPAVQVLWEKMRRAVRKNRSDVGLAVQNQTPKMIQARTKSGLYLPEPLYGFDLGPEERFHTMFRRIVQGLYYHHTGILIPSSFRIKAHRANPDEEQWARLNQLNLRIGSKGDAVQYACAVAAEDKLSSLWVITFYDVIHFMVSALNPQLADEAGSPWC